MFPMFFLLRFAIVMVSLFTCNIKHANEPVLFYRITIRLRAELCLIPHATCILLTEVCEHQSLPDSYAFLFPPVVAKDDYFQPLFPVDITSFRV